MEFDLRTDDLSATDLEDNFDKNDTSPEVQTLKKNVKRTSPTGKLIDIATNDLMKSSRACSCCCRTSIW